MKTSLIIHGACDREEYFSDAYPSLSNSHWLPWLQKQMLIAGYDPSRRKDPSFFDFKIDNQLARRTEIHILTSDNDSADINSSVQTVRAALPESKLHVFPGCGHFCHSDMGTDTFPELKRIALEGSR